MAWVPGPCLCSPGTRLITSLNRGILDATSIPGTIEPLGAETRAVTRRPELHCQLTWAAGSKLTANVMGPLPSVAKHGVLVRSEWILFAKNMSLLATSSAADPGSQGGPAVLIHSLYNFADLSTGTKPVWRQVLGAVQQLGCTRKWQRKDKFTSQGCTTVKSCV